MPPEAMDSASNIMIEDFFEGWLSIPLIRNLFEEDFWETSKHQPDNLKVQLRQEAIALNPTQLDRDTNRQSQSQLCKILPKTKVKVNHFQDLLKLL